MNSNGYPSVIVNPDMLTDGYIPENLKAREDQFNQIMYCLSPVLERHRAINAWLYGKPGTGKTTTAIHALRNLEQKAPVKGIIVNCWQNRTFYEIIDAMITEFRVLRADEHRTSFKLERLRHFLKDSHLIVLLDEVDRIRPRELSTVLYNLDSILDASLICISASTQPLTQLDERIRSRLNPHPIPFPAYTEEELLEILADRAGLALAEGSWSQAHLRNITSAAHGDARSAIGMLHKVAVMTQNEQADRIAETILKEQLNASKEAIIESSLNCMTIDHKILYQIVKQRGQILSGDLWQKYLQHCEQVERKPLAARTFSDYINRLAQTGLIASERARVKGKVRLFKIIM
jgi:cell division control protein 6